MPVRLDVCSGIYVCRYYIHIPESTYGYISVRMNAFKAYSLSGVDSSPSLSKTSFGHHIRLTYFNYVTIYEKILPICYIMATGASELRHVGTTYITYAYESLSNYRYIGNT